MLWFRLKLAMYAAVQAWRKAPAALEAVRKSNDTGQGWDAYDFPDGFVDLYGPCCDRLYRK